MTRVLELTLETDNGREPIGVRVGRVYNLGFTIRDVAKQQRHVDEVAREGVPPPKVEKPPLIIPIGAWAIVTDTEIDVQYEKTNAEVEIVTIANGSEILVGIGSDHTDRDLESHDIPRSKQVCPNVIAPVVWRWDEVAYGWDDVALESYAINDEGPVLYQSARAAEFWTPVEMLASIQDRVAPATHATVLFSGTVVSTEERLRYDRRWSFLMRDPMRQREIRHEYYVNVLTEEIQ